jgi:hypothetical protein
LAESGADAPDSMSGNVRTLKASRSESDIAVFIVEMTGRW